MIKIAFRFDNISTMHFILSSTLGQAIENASLFKKIPALTFLAQDRFLINFSLHKQFLMRRSFDD